MLHVFGMSGRLPIIKDYYSSPKSPLYPISPGGYRQDLWIGEETKRSLPPHVYKYYLQRTRSYRRQSLKVGYYFSFTQPT